MTKQVEHKNVLSEKIESNLRDFIEEKTNSPNGIWKGRLTKRQQYHLFGCIIGGGMTLIDGEKKVITHQRIGGKHSSSLVRVIKLKETNWRELHQQLYAGKTSQNIETLQENINITEDKKSIT